MSELLFVLLFVFIIYVAIMTLYGKKPEFMKTIPGFREPRSAEETVELPAY